MSVPLYPIESWIQNVGLAALSSMETLLTTYDLARNVIERGVAGDFVECGVFGGAQSAMMARAIMDGGYLLGKALDNGRDVGVHAARAVLGQTCDVVPQNTPTSLVRRVHLFDTFAGMPAEAGPHDHEWNHPVGSLHCCLEDCKSHMREWGIPDELLVWHEGLFADRIREFVPYWASPPDIALLRIDGDLYESTKDALQLLPLVSPGGWVISDDFALSGARKAFDESGLYTGGSSMPGYWKISTRPTS